MSGVCVALQFLFFFMFCFEATQRPLWLHGQGRLEEE